MKNIFFLKPNTKKIKKVLIFSIIILFFNINNAFAFDFPSVPENFYVCDNANILSKETEDEIRTILLDYKKEKDIESSFITISESVGDKKYYTSELKKWWNIGSKNNGLIIAIYPKSKDNVEIIIDSGLEEFISSSNAKKYKEKIDLGIKNDNLDKEIKEIIEDIELKLKDYSKLDTKKEVIGITFDKFLFKLKPKNNFSWIDSFFAKLLGEFKN